MKCFERKGYGRIYVDKPENVEFVIRKIKELDKFEFEYLPGGFVVPFSEYPRLVYTYKFDSLDCDKLTAECWKEGVYIFCLDNGHNEFIDDK